MNKSIRKGNIEKYLYGGNKNLILCFPSHYDGKFIVSVVHSGLQSLWLLKNKHWEILHCRIAYGEFSYWSMDGEYSGWYDITNIKFTGISKAFIQALKRFHDPKAGGDIYKAIRYYQKRKLQADLIYEERIPSPPRGRKKG